MNRQILIFTLFLIAFVCVYPLKAQDFSTEKSSEIFISENEIAVNYLDTIIGVNVITNVDYVVEPTADWIHQFKKEDESNGNRIYFLMDMNVGQKREAFILLKATDNSIVKQILIKQQSDNLAEYIKGDAKIQVSSGWASSYQSGAGVEKSIDGNLNTIYHSNWTNTSTNYFPITLRYDFTNVDKMDYFIYYPRTSGSNGHFKEVEVWYTTQTQQRTKLGDFDLKGSGATHRFDLTGSGLENPTRIELVVKSGIGDGQGFATCAEMEFYKKTEDKSFDVFGDPLWTTLKADVTSKTLDTMSNLFVKDLATKILNKNYSFNYRVATYKAYKDPSIIGQELHIGNGYSRFENMTGILLHQGKNIVVVENLPVGKTVNLLIPNLYRRATSGYAPDKDPKGWGLYKHYYPLANGVNVIDVKDWDGLGYISYYSATPELESTIKVHFINGLVNGYFDVERGDTNDDWDHVLKNAVYPIIDACGKHVHLAYPVADLKRYAPHKGLELLQVYDTLLSSQYYLIGLEKYNKVPDNHLFARVNYNYYMFRDGDGVAFRENTMNRVANPDHLKNNDEDACWGFSHEVGHVHQLQPYLNWGGLGEVSNNICSRYCTQIMGYNSRLGNAFQKAKDILFDKNKSFLNIGDVFVTLVPFWQLQCYYSDEQLGNKKEFFPDLYEALRHTPDEQPNEAVLGTNWATFGRRENSAVFQLNFVKKASVVAGRNLWKYFEKYGFFYVGSFTLDDYGPAPYNMTQGMLDQFKTEMDALGLPDLDDATLEQMLNAHD